MVMAQQYPGSWKQCATCAFWCGARECDYWATQVKVDSSGTQGKCMIPSGGWRGQNRQASATCTAWQKWPVLR